MSIYNEAYYEGQQAGSLRSAREIVPLVIDLVQPKTVIDVGCGVGTWLSVFRKCGVEDVLGIDGDYIDRSMLQIPAEKFLPADLKEPFHSDRQFDLVISLEVVEHLPKACAETFVASLVKLGPVILFSAAVPFQRGTHHINAQWPDYWKQYFQLQGYVAVDALRKKIWQNDKIGVFYRQNILMFVKEEYLMSNAVLKNEYEKTNIEQLSIVHPEHYTHHCLYPLATRFKQVAFVIENYLKQKLKRIFQKNKVS